MDYYIFVTRACNLRCTYCCFAGQLVEESKPGDKHPDAERTARFILEDIEKKGYQDNKVFYYGGEPLVGRKWIKRFMEIIGDQVIHVAQTNGMLLSKLEPEMVSRFRYLEVSIDGVRSIHDEFRGAGTYDRLLKNLKAIEGTFTGDLCARMTYTPDNPLARSVVHILDDLRFHDVYWMHEDSTIPIEHWEANLPRYEAALDELIDYWMSHLRRGVVKGIIPFQSIVESMIDPPEHPHVRCGVGQYLTVIDNDGTCYPCDLMITADKRYAVGHIDEGIETLRLPKNELRDTQCRSCEDFPHCGGRCYHLSLTNDARFPLFCERTKMLIRKLEAVFPEIVTLIKEGVVSEEELRIQVSMTEQIP